MQYSAAKVAKEIAATYGVKLSTTQYNKFVDVLARALIEAHNIGYKKGLEAGEG